jgi:hypothetical protein
MTKRAIGVAALLATLVLLSAFLAATAAASVAAPMCSDFNSGNDCGGAPGDALCPDGQDCFDTGDGCQCRPRVCCKCESVSGSGSCDLPCTQTGIGLLVCVAACAFFDDADNDCNLKIVNNTTCPDGGNCPTTGCCTFAETSNARAAAPSICVETDQDTCGLLPFSQFISAGSCTDGLFGACASPTQTPTATITATATNTATATSTGTATLTRTVTQTPTPTLVPNGGECATPAECSSTFCVDGVCCDTICDQPFQTCNQPGDPGVCQTIAAPAPALSRTGLLAVIAVLALVGAMALMWRRQS